MLFKRKPINQEEKILKLLRKAGNKGVPNYIFPRHHILRLSARIANLRADGYNIYCERQYLPNGRATSVFKYYLGEQDGQ